MKIEYWSIWGNSWRYICGKHKSLRKVRREAKICEESGGSKHKIYKVQLISDSKKKEK